ncbi:hypothetical protein [Endozoicomonas arenosclerae]|uniref:hypothetical protein n=1 Tax=Endozoicomonas arenosclerae TaxID=1633495 RepID=UPI000784A7D2|nr:hypothetical protein [Endozoicomonas arenosclerae]
MEELQKILNRLDIIQWSIVLSYFISWLGLTALASSISERKFIRRETVAIISFFIPFLLLLIELYLMT